MTVDCEKMVHARAVVAPLECRRLVERLELDFVLTDVVFELDDHPHGSRSKACGAVWNALPGRWSRKLLGGHVDDAGRRYHLTTGLLCPRGSWLSVCTCLFVNQPTSRLWAVLSGYYCEGRPPFDHGDIGPGEVTTIDWMDTAASDTLDPMEPTGGTPPTPDMGAAMITRSLRGTTRAAVERGELWIDGTEGRAPVPPAGTVAVRIAGDELGWTGGGRSGSSRLPEGTNLVVVRRSVDGCSMHVLCYAEDADDGGGSRDETGVPDR